MVEKCCPFCFSFLAPTTDATSVCAVFLFFKIQVFLLALCKMKENTTFFLIAFSLKQSFLGQKSEKQLM